MLRSCFPASFNEFCSAAAECVSTNQKPGLTSLFPDRSQNKNFVEDITLLLPVKIFVEFCSPVEEKKSKM